MAFRTLFPDGKGYLSNSATMRDVTLGDKIKHLIKFAEYNNGKWTYKFASHPRFAYWAFIMIQRHRLLSQGNIFLKQNSGDAKLVVEQLSLCMMLKMLLVVIAISTKLKRICGLPLLKQDLQQFCSLYLVPSTSGMNFMNFFVTLTLNTFNQRSGSKIFLKTHIFWIGFLLSEQIVLSRFG